MCQIIFIVIFDIIICNTIIYNGIVHDRSPICVCKQFLPWSWPIVVRHYFSTISHTYISVMFARYYSSIFLLYRNQWFSFSVLYVGVPFFNFTIIFNFIQNLPKFHPKPSSAQFMYFLYVISPISMFSTYSTAPPPHHSSFLFIPNITQFH